MVKHILLAAAGLAAFAACSTSGRYNDPRQAWEVTAWASKRADGLYSVRTVTVAPDTCYAPGELRAAPSTRTETIELQTNVIRAVNGPCSNYKTDIVQELPAMRLEPDDRNIEVVVFADGGERNRVLLNVEDLQPITASYQPRYDPRDPRYRY